MENIIKFKYNGKIWNPKNPEKKLKQLGITWDDVEIVKDDIKEAVKEEYMNPDLYEFKNVKTGETILSIYNNLDSLPIDKENYELIGKVVYE